MNQSWLDRYLSILRFHGPVNGPRRAWEQFSQIDLYDWQHNISTRHPLMGEEFLAGTSVTDQGAVSFYGPNYTAATVRPLKHLIATQPSMGSTKLAFIDLGCGKGKVIHVARRLLPRAKLFGVDLHPRMIDAALANLGSGVSLIQSNVLDIDYNTLLSGSDVIVAFNKNSFDRHTTAQTLDRLRSCAPIVFYVFSNPVYEDLFSGFPCVFSMNGWHKNWHVKAWKVSG